MRDIQYMNGDNRVTIQANGTRIIDECGPYTWPLNIDIRVSTYCSFGSGIALIKVNILCISMLYPKPILRQVVHRSIDHLMRSHYKQPFKSLS
jgi:hypothetical protein